MRKIAHLLRLVLLSLLTLAAASRPVDNIRQILAVQLKESSDTEEIITMLQNAEGLAYKLGSRGNGVRAFQNLLTLNGYSTGKVYGTYSDKTAAAVREFQSANNLPVTGDAEMITQFSLVMNGGSFTRKKGTYIAQAGEYAVIIWPGKSFYVGALDKSGSLLEGTYCYFSGGYYAGEYNNNQRSGKGTAHFANGDVYTGQWRNDAMNGYGTYSYHDSAGYYKGSMSKNKMHGKGTYYLNGKKTTGTWSDNNFVR